jgi:hypothetical protein
MVGFKRGVWVGGGLVTKEEHENKEEVKEISRIVKFQRASQCQASLSCNISYGKLLEDKSVLGIRLMFLRIDIPYCALVFFLFDPHFAYCTSHAEILI